MVSVLLVVFLLQVAINIFNSIGSKTINDLLWYIFTHLPVPQAKDADDSVKLRNEVTRLKRELAATSAQDEFSKWARLRREHDKAKDKYENLAREQQNFRTTFDRAGGILRWIGIQGLNFICNTWYSKQAMFWLPQGWLPYHAEWILSFPSAPLGSISVNIWGIACASVIGLVAQAAKAA